MHSLPVQEKPIVEMRYDESVYHIPNVITKEIASDLIAYALDESSSGLHRRGSKTAGIAASFSTCLVRDTDDIYTTLDPLWKQYLSDIPVTIDFVEKYEIKIYHEGDGFGYHFDNHGSMYHRMDRKINLIIQLSPSSDYEGGDLLVGDHVCSREFGSALFFPANYLHCVTPITRGTRVSLIGHAWGPINR